jgi:hypothetical protein
LGRRRIDRPKIQNSTHSLRLWDNSLVEFKASATVKGVVMGFRPGFVKHLFISLVFAVTLSTAAFADGSHERTQFGHDITIGPSEGVTDVTCFGCSVRVRGHVTGDVTTFGGSVMVEDNAEISGDTTTFAGNVRLDKGAKLAGDVTVFGGRLHRDPAASVAGDVTNFAGTFWILLIFGLPFVILGAIIALIVWIVRRLTRPALPAAA